MFGAFWSIWISLGLGPFDRFPWPPEKIRPQLQEHCWAQAPRREGLRRLALHRSWSTTSTTSTKIHWAVPFLAMRPSDDEVATFGQAVQVYHMSVTCPSHFFKISLNKFKRVEVGLYRWMRQEKLWQCLGALYQLSRHGTHLEIFGSDFPIFSTWTLILENPCVKELASVASFFHSVILFPQAHKTYSQKVLVASHFTASVQKYDAKKGMQGHLSARMAVPSLQIIFLWKCDGFHGFFLCGLSWCKALVLEAWFQMVRRSAESLQTWSHFTLSNRYQKVWEGFEKVESHILLCMKHFEDYKNHWEICSCSGCTERIPFEGPKRWWQGI